MGGESTASRTCPGEPPRDLLRRELARASARRGPHAAAGGPGPRVVTRLRRRGRLQITGGGDVVGF